MTGLLFPESCKKVVFCLFASQILADFWNVWDQSRRHDLPLGMGCYKRLGTTWALASSKVRSVTEAGCSRTLSFGDG